MWSSKMSWTLQIMILRYIQTKQIFYFLLFLQPFNCPYLWNQLTNFNGPVVKGSICNRCIDVINQKKYKAVLEPRVSPAFAITYFCNLSNIRFENTSKYVDTLTLFSKNLNQRSLTPRWPLTPCLLRSHVWLYPRIIVSKSHDNTSTYVDTVINFAEYHIHTTYIHTTYILRTEWVIT